MIGEWFLGFIIICYIVFPILRKYVIEKPICLAIVTSLLYLISIIMNNHGYNVLQFSDLFSRLPEFLFGMYFIYYFKKVKIIYFAIATSILLVLKFINIDIDVIFLTTISGISLFSILVFISQNIKNIRIKRITSFISKYSFQCILANQIVMIYVMKRFSGLNITPAESYLLFGIVSIVILLVAIVVSKISNKAVTFIREPNKIGG